MKLLVKCPKCGNIVKFPKRPQMETYLVTCTKCKYKGPFPKFEVVGEIPDSESKKDIKEQVKNEQKPPKVPEKETPPLVPHDNDNSNQPYKETPPPKPPIDVDYWPVLNILPGQLRDESTGYVYELKRGRNVVGRQSANSDADVQIPTGGDKHMSRKHLVISVSMVKDRGLVPVAELYKQEVNATYINGTRLSYGDRVELKDGDTIGLPGKSLKYEIPDTEETMM